MGFDQIFLDRLVRVTRLYEGLIEVYQVENLHKYRVNLRKIYAYNEIFCKDIDPIGAVEFSKSLKKVIKPTSLLRDLDLFVGEIDSFALSFETTRVMKESFEIQRELLLDQIKSEEYKQNLYALSKIFVNLPLYQSNFDEKRSYDLLVISSQNLLHEFSLITKATTLKNLHKLRIRFKKFRYALELYEEQFSYQNHAVSNLFDLKKLQDLFGIMQDNEVRKSLLETFTQEIDADEKMILLKNFEKNIADTREKLMQLARECNV